MAGPVRTQEDVTRVVLRLLAQAERTDFDDEARALTAKAAELAQTHAVTEAMVDAFRSAGERARPTRIDVRYSANKSFLTQRITLLATVAEANDCTTLYAAGDPTAELFGFEDDLRFVQVLYTSLLTQMTRQGDRALASVEAGVRMRNRYAWRRQFYIGFVVALGPRLQETRRLVVAEADRRYPGKAELVLVGRKAEVDQLVRSAYPRLRKNGGRSTISDPNAFDRGKAAGRQADISGGRVPRGAAGYVGQEAQREVTGR